MSQCTGEKIYSSFEMTKLSDSFEIHIQTTENYTIYLKISGGREFGHQSQNILPVWKDYEVSAYCI